MDSEEIEFLSMNNAVLHNQIKALQTQLESEKVSHAAWEKQSLLEYSEVVQERDALLKAIKLALDESPVDRDILREALAKLKDE